MANTSEVYGLKNTEIELTESKLMKSKNPEIIKIINLTSRNIILSTKNGMEFDIIPSGNQSIYDSNMPGSYPIFMNEKEQEKLELRIWQKD